MAWEIIYSPSELAYVIGHNVYMSFPNRLPAEDFEETKEDIMRGFHFDFSGMGTNYRLILRANGLIREITSPHSEPVGELQSELGLNTLDMSGIKNVIVLTPNPVGVGSFEDYQRVGRYARKKLPCIAKDFVSNIKKVDRTGPERWWRPVEERNKEAIKHWEQLQGQAFELFHEMFCHTALERNNFSPQQVGALTEIVSDLRHYKPVLLDKYNELISAE